LDKNGDMDLLIKEEILEKAEITAEELIIEIAVHLYDIGRLSMGQARNLAQLDQISFQKEMAKRDVYIQYDIKDLETDLENLRKLKGRKAS
jgi:predicted HTH domain antitoxin